MKATPVQFVKTWQASETLSEIAQALGMTLSAVKSRGYTYRKRGVNLKQLSTQTQTLDVEALNEMIANNRFD